MPCSFQCQVTWAQTSNAATSPTLLKVDSGTSGGSANSLGDEELLAEELERKRTENVVKLAATDQLNSEIITNRTRGGHINIHT